MVVLCCEPQAEPPSESQAGVSEIATASAVPIVPIAAAREIAPQLEPMERPDEFEGQEDTKTRTAYFSGCFVTTHSPDVQLPQLALFCVFCDAYFLLVCGTCICPPFCEVNLYTTGGSHGRYYISEAGGPDTICSDGIKTRIAKGPNGQLRQYKEDALPYCFLDEYCCPPQTYWRRLR